MKSYLSFLILITLMMRNSAYAQIVYPSIGYDKTDEITPPEGTEITYKYLLMNVEDISWSNALDSVGAIEKIIVDTIVYDRNGLVIQKKSDEAEWTLIDNSFAFLFSLSYQRFGACHPKRQRSNIGLLLGQ